MNAIKYYRLKNNLSQRELAELIGTKRYVILYAELGQTNVSEKNAAKLAAVLNCSPSQLVGRNAQVNANPILPHLSLSQNNLTKMQQLFLAIKLKR